MPLNNHDSTFKQLMSHRVFLEGFIKTYLPKELLAKLNWDSIQLHKMGGTFIEESTQKESESDVIYLAEMENKANLLWFHFEHQSSPDESMPLRILSYQVAELLNYRKQHPTQKLPSIVTIIYHQGERKWPYSLNIQDLFLNPELAMQYFGKPILVDLPTLPDEELKKHYPIGPVELILKHVRQADFERKFRLMVMSLRGVDDNSKAIVLKYILDFIDIPNDEYLKTIGECLPDNMELVMSLSERLVQQGIQQGVQQGFQQGIYEGLQQGFLDGRLEMARNMFLKNLDESLIQEITKLSKETLSDLKRKMKH